MPASYVVFLSVAGAETGLWCDTCLLPSRVRVSFILTTETGSSDTAVPPLDMCTDCGRRF